jgi:hypothetical protein
MEDPFPQTAAASSGEMQAESGVMETIHNVPGLKLRVIPVVAACLLFAGANYQWPLFSSNQNTYFLSGLAHAGFGHLSSDWLAQQTDPVPVFSALVSLVHGLGGHWMFYVLHGLLAAIYLFRPLALMLTGKEVPVVAPIPRQRQAAPLFLALVAVAIGIASALPYAFLQIGRPAAALESTE